MVPIRQTTQLLIMTGLMVGLVGGLVWYGGGTYTAMPHLMYLPIIFATVRVSTEAGVVTAFVGGLLMAVVPSIVGDAASVQPLSSMAIRTGVYIFAAVMAGRAVVSLRQRAAELEETSLQSVTLLANTLEANHRYTAGHSLRVSRISRLIGTALQLSETDLTTLTTGALLHDIGKIGVPTEILDKPGRLTAEEFELVKLHSTQGDTILRDLTHRFAPGIRDIVRHHHERMDGSGYPDRLAGEQISLLARIVAVADVFEALTSDRAYRPGMSQSDALSVIQAELEAGKFDPVVVRALKQVLSTEVI